MTVTYEQLRHPDWWTRGMTWGECYEYFNEWARLLCGTRKRYDWLKARRRITDDADEILSHQLKIWRTVMGFSQDEAAQALDLTRRTLYAYETGKRPIPRVVEYACLYLNQLARLKRQRNPERAGSFAHNTE